MISYAGVDLCVDTPPFWALLERGVDPREVVFHSEWRWPSPGLARLAMRHAAWLPKVRVGRLYWPRHAARFAHAYYVVSDRQLDLIRAQVYYGTSNYRACPLVIDDGKRRISTDLWMLPAHPLAQITGYNGLWLLCLVDARWFWWYRDGAIAITAGVTTWAQLYSAIGTALGEAIVVDTVPAAYLTPSVFLSANYEALPLLLDAAAVSVGQVIVRSLAGVVKAQNASVALASQEANAALSNPILAMGGGQMALEAP